MNKKYFKCTLLSDVVFNASLATEGNMQSLDYIPGSNFLGIVAGQIYNEMKSAYKAYDIFHSGKISFGNAYIADKDVLSYPIPFVLFQDKLKTGIASHKTWLNPYENSSELSIQWEQHRGGFFNFEKVYFKEVEKKFSLKSAYNAEERRSKEGAMFGFDSLLKGQEFIFSVDFHESIDESTREKVINALTGKRRVGKSKSAQYGQVEIKKIDQPKTFENGAAKKNELWIYAESNLCFLNEYKQSTFRPTAEHFGISGEINWAQSQIRTYSYSPWNSHRNTTNTQRDVILKGSVIVFSTENQVVINSLKQKVGEYQEDGLGRVLYNPAFLEQKNGLWVYSKELTDYNDNKEEEKENNNVTSSTIIKKTALGVFLQSKKIKAANELKIGTAVQAFLRKHRAHPDSFKDITPSQWGVIRIEAIRAESWKNLSETLFGVSDGILTKGVAYDRYWGKNGGRALTDLKENFDDNKALGKKYMAKLATEMAKETQRKPSKIKEHEVHA